jgi:hypothetical protein
VKKKKFIIISLSCFLTLTLCSAIILFAQELSEYSNPYHDSLGTREKATFSPLEGPILAFGNLNIDKEGIIKWDNGQQAKIKVLKYDKNNIIVEFISDPLPVFNNQAYKFMRFQLVAMDEIEINFYKAMYITNFFISDKDLEGHSNLWGIYLLKFPEESKGDKNE